MVERPGRIEGKVAVVTGGCSGIGLATVRRFAEEGAKVVIADLNDDLGAQLAEELGGTYVHCNVADKAEVDNLFKVAFPRGGVRPRSGEADPTYPTPITMVRSWTDVSDAPLL